MDILRVENLCKVYGKGDTAVRALDNVSFTIQKGDFVAIVGPSGSGKSTLLHILGGVDTPSSGKVYIDNTDVYSLSETNLAIFRRRQIGLIYQFFNLVPVLNVEENITLPLLLDGRKVQGGRWQKETHDFLSLPLMVRPGTVLPLGAHDDRPDYDYLDGVELHVYQLADGESETVEIPDTKGSVAATFTVTMKDGQAQVETDSTKPYTVVVHQ